jgi:hypothetical protein
MTLSGKDFIRLFQRKTWASYLRCAWSEAVKKLTKTGWGPRPLTRGKPRSIEWFCHWGNMVFVPQSFSQDTSREIIGGEKLLAVARTYTVEVVRRLTGGATEGGGPNHRSMADRVSCETDFFSFGSNRNKPKHWQFRFCFGIFSERI